MLTVHPTLPLVDRALALLAAGPRNAEALVEEVMGLPNAPDAVAARLVAALLATDPRVSQLPDGRWGLVPAAAGSPMLDQVPFAVVDVETTGIRADGHRILEVGIVVVQGSRREMVLDRLVNPGRPVPRVITSITRISDADVRDAPTFAAVADEVLGALSGRVFVAHNARFDWAFLAAELRRSRGASLTGARLCTARLARRLIPEAESCGLDWLSTWFGLENPARHRAGGDAWATAELLLRLLERARGEGARTLQDLEAMQLGRGRRKRRVGVIASRKAAKPSGRQPPDRRGSSGPSR
jgi:DNA polymerase III epsilon subunit family exonuclease